jgi:hypothetical protein
MRKVIILLFLFAFGAAGVSAYLFFSEIASGFPTLQNGVYVGHLEIAGETPKLIPWMVERRAGSPETYVTLADDLFPAQRIPHALASGAQLPLIVDGPSARYRLIGRSKAAGVYSGDLLNPITQEKGTWTLKRVDLESLSPTKQQELQDWAERWNEVVVVEHKIEAAQAKLAEQKAKLDKISSFVTEGDALKQKANSRLGATTEAVSAVRGRVKELQAALDDSLRDIELSERVSTRGRLVQLSREAIAREARWIGASIQVGGNGGNATSAKELEKAQRVKLLKSEIASERAKLAELDSARRYGGESAETSEEAEFYSNFQNQ